MNNLLSYCGLVDAKMKASDKDLPVQKLHAKGICVFVYIFCKLESAAAPGSQQHRGL